MKASQHLQLKTIFVIFQRYVLKEVDPLVIAVNNQLLLQLLQAPMFLHNEWSVIAAHNLSAEDEKQAFNMGLDPYYFIM